MQAYDSIKNGILNGELEPGQLYSETKLSAKIGISRTPMREALQCLSQDGYITIIPSKGFMIRQLNEKDMKDSIQIRCAIEGFCTTVIASQTDTKEGKELLRSLKMILDNMEEALNSDALEDFIYYDHQFHLLIVNYLHNDEFNQIFQRLLYLIAHLGFPDEPLLQGLIIKSDPLFGFSVNGICGQPRPVAEEFHGNGTVFCGADRAGTAPGSAAADPRLFFRKPR